jgi:hypothetical protein
LLSEYTTPTQEDISDNDFVSESSAPLRPTIWGKNFNEYDFLDEIIASKNETDQRLVQVYESQDLWRTKKWAKANPK